VSLRQGICASATDTGTASVETGNAVQDMANMLGIPRKPTTAAALPGGEDSHQSEVTAQAHNLFLCYLLEIHVRMRIMDVVYLISMLHFCNSARYSRTLHLRSRNLHFPVIYNIFSGPFSFP
jgi:hypothetical protein